MFNKEKKESVHLSEKFGKVLAAVDGTADSMHAVDLVINNFPKSKIIPVHVIEIPMTQPLEVIVGDQENVGERILQEAEHKWHIHSGDLIQSRSVGGAIIREAAELGADVIVMGLKNDERLRKGEISPNVDIVLKGTSKMVVVVRPALK